MAFGRKKQELEEEVELASDRIVFKQLTDKDEEAKELVVELREGAILCINFEKLNEDSGNKYLSFFIGAITALEGKVARINEYTYLFARLSDYYDGSLKKWLEALPKE